MSRRARPHKYMFTKASDLEYAYYQVMDFPENLIPKRAADAHRWQDIIEGMLLLAFEDLYPEEEKPATKKAGKPSIGILTAVDLRKLNLEPAGKKPSWPRTKKGGAQ
jgi:hypothetical protein